MDKINWEVSSFDGLDIHSLYKILRLRSEVFIVEQNSVYQDLDNKDQKAIHVQGFIKDNLVVYCRLFKAGDYFEEASIGRVIIAEEFRNKGYGHILMDKAIELMAVLLNEHNITISAQLYLKVFYEKHGFAPIGETYIEDGIPHIRMKRILQAG